VRPTERRKSVGANGGIRPELKAIVTKHTYTGASIGVFYVVPSDWP